MNQTEVNEFPARLSNFLAELGRLLIEAEIERKAVDSSVSEAEESTAAQRTLTEVEAQREHTTNDHQ